MEIKGYKKWFISFCLYSYDIKIKIDDTFCYKQDKSQLIVSYSTYLCLKIYVRPYQTPKIMKM